LNSTRESFAFLLKYASSVPSLTPYESPPTGGLMQQGAVSVSSGQFNYTLPAQSIVTLVQ